MRNWKRVALVATTLAAGVLAVTASGIASGSHSTRGAAALKFAMITHGDPSDPFFAVVKNGENAAAKTLGVTATYQSSANPQTEIQYIQAAVNQHVNGLAIAYDNPSVEAAVKKAAAAGIPVYGLNSGLTDFPANGEIGYVGQDEGIAGQAVGNALNKVGGLKHVLCVIHYAGAVNLEQRCAGVKATFKGTVTNINVPTCTTGAIRGVAVVPAATATNGRPLNPSNCLSTVTTLNDDIDAFTNGFISVSSIGNG